VATAVARLRRRRRSCSRTARSAASPSLGRQGPTILSGHGGWSEAHRRAAIAAVEAVAAVAADGRFRCLRTARCAGASVGSNGIRGDMRCRGGRSQRQRRLSRSGADGRRRVSSSRRCRHATELQSAMAGPRIRRRSAAAPKRWINCALCRSPCRSPISPPKSREHAGSTLFVETYLVIILSIHHRSAQVADVDIDDWNTSEEGQPQTPIGMHSGEQMHFASIGRRSLVLLLVLGSTQSHGLSSPPPRARPVLLAPPRTDCPPTTPHGLSSCPPPRPLLAQYSPSWVSWRPLSA